MAHLPTDRGHGIVQRRLPLDVGHVGPPDASGQWDAVTLDDDTVSSDKRGLAMVEVSQVTHPEGAIVMPSSGQIEAMLDARKN
jgi:hypothetical protein